MAPIFKSFNRKPTREEAELALTQMAIAEVMRMVTSDPVRLLEVVAGGHVHWRIHFRRAMRGYRLVDDQVADVLFKDFADRVVAMYGGLEQAKQLLDQVEVHEQRPPTAREIDEGWDVESWSSEEGRRYFYGANHPAEIVKQLVH